MAEPNKALVVFSGGQDSTTCLFLARRYNPHGTHALTFNYGQRHHQECVAAARISHLAGVEHETLILHESLFRSKSPLVSYVSHVQTYGSFNEMPGGVEPTFIEGRNLLFLSIAFNRAALFGCREIWIGVSQADYGGYPDCRKYFIDKMEVTGNSALGRDVGDPNYIAVRAPLIDMDKVATVNIAREIQQGGEGPIMEALSMSHTCYQGQCPPCGHCHACILRAKGFHGAGIGDPLIIECKKEGKLADAYPDSGLVVK